MSNPLLSTFFVLDVESVGLHGQGFAVGWVVVDRRNKELDSGYLSTDPVHAKEGAEGDRTWIAENVLPHLPAPTINAKGPDASTNLPKLYTDFWPELLKWTNRGAAFWADCGFPVETNFLSACINYSTKSRYFDGPYPLQEIASVMTVAGMNPLEHYDRLENELPKHHPTADARQSARLLIEALDKLEDMADGSRA